MSMCRPALAALIVLACGESIATPPNVTAVTRLADRYVSEVRDNYPVRYAASGLPSPRRDRLDINAPAELARWRQFLGEIEREANAIDLAAIEGKPEWLTLAQLRQAVEQDRALEICRSELWSVRSYGWPSVLAQIAELQPVDEPSKRAAILERFGAVPAFADQEIANLREGLRLGYSSPRLVVDAAIADLDKLLSQPLIESAFGSPAERAGDDAFGTRWTDTLEKKLTPTLARYRDFLKSEYRLRARANPSITANKNGKECFRAIVAANSSIDVDPAALFERASARAEEETRLALGAGKKRYGRDFPTLAALAEALRQDPKDQFKDEARLREFISATIRRGKAKSVKVVPTVPETDVESRPYSEAVGDSAPSGEYIPRDEEGRPPIYFYRTDFANLSPSRLEATVLHETWPGHHLQSEITQAKAKRATHALAQLVYIPGVGEGWATYVEGLARELSLYDSELGAIGSVMNSMTPRLVADIGMHVYGWSEERAFKYLVEKFPATPAERVRITVGAIAEEPGWMVPYAAGAIEIENLRDDMRRKQGEKFDLRQFHQLIIEDGTVPFAALRAKLGLLPR